MLKSLGNHIAEGLYKIIDDAVAQGKIQHSHAIGSSVFYTVPETAHFNKGRDVGLDFTPHQDGASHGYNLNRVKVDDQWRGSSELNPLPAGHQSFSNNLMEGYHSSARHSSSADDLRAARFQSELLNRNQYRNSPGQVTGSNNGLTQGKKIIADNPSGHFAVTKSAATKRATELGGQAFSVPLARKLGAHAFSALLAAKLEAQAVSAPPSPQLNTTNKLYQSPHTGPSQNAGQTTSQFPGAPITLPVHEL